MIRATAPNAPRILAVGSVNMDLVLRAERLPAAGETVVGRDYAYIPGGKGANQAVAASRMGASVVFVGRVGADVHGASLKKGLAGQGIDTRNLAETEAAPTGLAAILLDESGQNRIIIYPGANFHIPETAVAGAFESEGIDGVVVNLEIPDGIVKKTCAEARRRGVPVILDAGPVRSFDRSIIEGVEILSPNESETNALTGLDCGGRESAEQAARALMRALKPRYVVLKLGERGALLCDGEGCEHFPSYKVEAVDATAAGDAFTGALACEYLKSGDIRAAVRTAVAAGALAVTRLGAQPSLPTAAEVREFMKEPR